MFACGGGAGVVQVGQRLLLQLAHMRQLIRMNCCICEIGVELRRVHGRLQIQWSRPVELGEEGVGHDLLAAVLPAYSALGVRDEQLAEQINRSGGEVVLREHLEVSTENAARNLGGGGIGERGIACKHLVEYNA
eukprot:scaffold321996_cov33-Tisochrysis_lutea.AAC.5